MRIRSQSPISPRRERGELRHRPAELVEQLLGAIATHPRLQHRQLARIFAHLREWHLVRAEGALDAHSVQLPRTSPTLRRPQHDQRPARAVTQASSARLALVIEDAVVGPLERRREVLVHARRLVAFHEPRLVAVPGEQRADLLVRLAPQHRR